EPTTGLDPQSRHSMWKMIKELNKTGITIFLTTQYLEEAEQLADQIAILDKGVIIGEGTPEKLKSYLPQGVVQFVFEDIETFEKAKSLIVDYKTSFLSKEYKLTVVTDGKADTLAQIFSRFYQNKLSIHISSQLTPNLEDAFLTMIAEREGES